MTPTEQAATDTLPVEPGARDVSFWDVPWRPRDVAMGFAPLVGIIVLLLGPARDRIPLLVWLFASVLAQLWVFAFPLVLARKCGWRPRLAVRSRRVVIEGLVAALSVVSAWAILAVGYFVWVALFGEPPRSNDPVERATQSGNPFGLFLLAVLGVLVAPVAEEVFFRGMLYRALRRQTVWPLAVLLQALAFGLMHANYGPTHIIITAFLGAWLALVYDLRKTLLTPILCHALHNAAVFVVAMLATGWTFDPPTVGVEGEPHPGGFLVKKVTPGSGAEAAGIRSGDILYTVNSWGVQSTTDVRNAIGGKKPGETIAVEYIRDGNLHRVYVVLRGRKELAPRD